MNASEAAAIATYPELADLIELRDDGWMFRVITANCDLVGFYGWPSRELDTLKIHSRTDAVAMRLIPSEPPGVVWEVTGTLEQVIAELRVLPAPGERTAPRLIKASAPQLWTP